MVLGIRGGRLALPIFATSWRRDRKVGPYRGIIRGSATRPPTLTSPGPPCSKAAQRLSHNLRSLPANPSRNHPTRTCPEEFRMVGGSYCLS
ncbi:hypothetical protein J6590_015396 [Homalodisca vitripennis]|nr:hypothetical protein J6590_015396 [Homalodisca vitripennis]